MFSLLTLNIFHNFFSVFIVDFEKVHISWVRTSLYFSKNVYKVFTKIICIQVQKQPSRGALWEITVLENIAKLTGKHLCGNLFLFKLQVHNYNFIKKRLWYRCFPVNFATFFRGQDIYGYDLLVKIMWAPVKIMWAPQRYDIEFISISTKKLEICSFCAI